MAKRKKKTIIFYLCVEVWLKQNSSAKCILGWLLK